MPLAAHAPLPDRFITRFAPAPTGFLHLGHVVSAIWVWGLARAHHATVLLRLEDHDRGRARGEFERAILDDLDWLGFEPDNGGTSAFRVGTTPFRQSDNVARYVERLGELEARALVYPCDCSRSTIARESPVEGDETPRYPGTCRNRSLDLARVKARRIRFEPGRPETFTDVRLGPQAQDPEAQCGDLLARDRNGNFTYQFATVVDDIDQGVTVVIRGEDLLASTGRQLRLASLLGRATPLTFLHHPLVRTPEGRKLSKSAGDTGVRELRAAGRTRDEVLGVAAQLAGVHASGRPLAPSDLPGLFA